MQGLGLVEDLWKAKIIATMGNEHVSRSRRVYNICFLTWTFSLLPMQVLEVNVREVFNLKNVFDNPFHVHNLYNAKLLSQEVAGFMVFVS